MSLKRTLDPDLGREPHSYHNNHPNKHQTNSHNNHSYNRSPELVRTPTPAHTPSRFPLGPTSATTSSPPSSGGVVRQIISQHPHPDPNPNPSPSPYPPTHSHLYSRPVTPALSAPTPSPHTGPTIPLTSMPPHSEPTPSRSRSPIRLRMLAPLAPRPSLSPVVLTNTTIRTSTSTSRSSDPNQVAAALPTEAAGAVPLAITTPPIPPLLPIMTHTPGSRTPIPPLSLPSPFGAAPPLARVESASVVEHPLAPAVTLGRIFTDPALTGLRVRDRTSSSTLYTPITPITPITTSASASAWPYRSTVIMAISSLAPTSNSSSATVSTFTPTSVSGTASTPLLTSCSSASLSASSLVSSSAPSSSSSSQFFPTIPAVSTPLSAVDPLLTPLSGKSVSSPCIHSAGGLSLDTPLTSASIHHSPPSLRPESRNGDGDATTNFSSSPSSSSSKRRARAPNGSRTPRTPKPTIPRGDGRPRRTEYAPHMRAYIIGLYEGGKSSSEIARDQSIPRSTVRYIIDHKEEVKARMGKSATRYIPIPKISSDDEGRILELVAKEPTVTYGDIIGKLGLQVSKPTLRNCLKRNRIRLPVSSLAGGSSQS